MIHEDIKKEIEQRGWSISRLASETGIRYPSLTEWFKENKELSTINLEKILNTLKMEVTKKTSGSRLPDYKKLVETFNGKDLICCETEMEIPEIEVVAYFFGVLTKTVSNHFQKEVSIDLSYGHVYDKFVQRTPWKNKSGDNKMVIDIPKSLCKPNFVRLADMYFTEKEKHLMAILLSYQFEEVEHDRDYLETQFLGGLFGSNSFS